jgi:hypothetical protein
MRVAQVDIQLLYRYHLFAISIFNCLMYTTTGMDLQWPATDEDKVEFNKDPLTYRPSWTPNFQFPASKELDKEFRLLPSGNNFKITSDGFNYFRVLV